MNPIQQTPPKGPDVDETPVANDPLDALLTQLINGFFVLTDGQGAVSKWSALPLNCAARARPNVLLPVPGSPAIRMSMEVQG